MFMDPRMLSPGTRNSTTIEIPNATHFCAGVKRAFAISAWCPRPPASATRSIWNTWPEASAWEKAPLGPVAYPDTLVGLDSHTTMINGLGVLGWGVGGIEAEAVMLGRPYYLLTPQVIGFYLEGKPARGTTATDLVLTITQMLRKKGVVGKFVEFFGPGVLELSHRGPGDHRQHVP